MRLQPCSISILAFTSAIAAVGCGGGSSPTESAAPAATVSADAEHAGWLRVPGGRLAHPSCVHVVPEGATVDSKGNIVRDGAVITPYAECGHEAFDANASSKPRTPTPQGIWHSNGPVPTLYAIGGANSPTFITSFGLGSQGTAGWVVPPAPLTNHGQTIFLGDAVTGVDFINQGTEIHHILQWGPIQEGFGTPTTTTNTIGGAYWQYQIWCDYYVGKPQTAWFVSSPIVVQPGQILSSKGTLIAPQPVSSSETQSPAGSGEWNLTATVTDANGANPKTTSLTFWSMAPMTTMYSGELATTGVTGCSDLPGTAGAQYTMFSNRFFTSGPNTSTTPVMFGGQLLPTWWIASQFNPQPYTGTWVAGTGEPSTFYGTGCALSASEYGGGTSIMY